MLQKCNKPDAQVLVGKFIEKPTKYSRLKTRMKTTAYKAGKRKSEPLNSGPVYIATPEGKVIRAFRRFVRTRGLYCTIYSDRSKTFKKASRLRTKYCDVMKARKFKEYLLEHKIQCEFRVVRAPWWGGLYKRLITNIKPPKKKVLGRSSLTIDEMFTVLTEVEAMVNSRPLSFIDDDPDDTSYLTPSSFLIGRPTTCIPVRPCTGKEPTAKLTRKELNKMLVNQNKYLNNCWKMQRLLIVKRWAIRSRDMHVFCNQNMEACC